MAKLNFGGVEENVVTRDEFPLSKAQEVLKNEVVAVIGYGVQGPGQALNRSEEHTSELQSRQYLVCRLLLEKKKEECSATASFIIDHEPRPPLLVNAHAPVLPSWKFIPTALPPPLDVLLPPAHLNVQPAPAR